jgi:methylated-DNA-protein-cysteine methyltransferase-like protein
MHYSEKSQDFFQQVYQVCREIPYGRVTTYGAIAKYLGAARSSRVVGWAMNGAHSQLEPVPAQRVVNRNGQLTGKIHFSTPFEMEEKLKLEGILVKNDTIIDFKKYFWDPSIELAL